jgi:hypothetical protein
MRIVEGGGLGRGEKEQWWQEQGRIYSTDFDFDYRSHYPSLLSSLRFGIELSHYPK